MILLLVNFKEISNYYEYPSTVQGLYGLLTEDPTVLDFHNKNLNNIPFSDPFYSRMKNFFFSEHEKHRFPAHRFLNECFKPATRLLSDSELKSNITNIVICEVG